MAVKRFDVGEVAHLAMTAKVAGVLTDPTTISLSIIDPSGDPSTYTYASASVTKDGVGLYSKDLSLSEEGTYRWRWLTTGTCAGADEGEVLVKSSAFV